MKQFIAIIILGAGLIGCETVPMGDPQQDATLKTFAVTPDKAGLYVYLDKFVGLAVKVDVELDGMPLGQTASNTYLYTPVVPGKHTISSSIENTDTLEMNFKAGSLMYVRQEVVYPRVKLHLMNETEGKKGVLATKLARNTPVTQVIEVNVRADDPAWSGPLECQAANSVGAWPFFAPGTVTVQPSTSPLQITCMVPAGAAMDECATVPLAREGAQKRTRKGAATGAAVGGGVGLALGAASVPVMGPAFAVILGVGSAFRGAEIGGLLGALQQGERLMYPSPIAIHIRSTSVTD